MIEPPQFSEHLALSAVEFVLFGFVVERLWELMREEGKKVRATFTERCKEGGSGFVVPTSSLVRCSF